MAAQDSQGRYIAPNESSTSAAVASAARTTADGTNYYTVLAFPQQTATTTGVSRVFGPLGSLSRWKWTVGGTDTPSFTFALSGTVDRDV